ncbi:hypothetical protein, partial [Pollutimonas nitritireducens]|uniref:hypothetical protein n=1 Tax=Pollutimonas nitritireducens TaxID=2045209 RepID=UPI001E56D732
CALYCGGAMAGAGSRPMKGALASAGKPSAYESRSFAVNGQKKTPKPKNGKGAQNTQGAF